MGIHYKLAEDGRTPILIPEGDFDEISLAWEDPNRIVGQTEVGDSRVSTVFLCLDHRFGGDGPPVLWETIVFGGLNDQWQDRYTSYEDAVAGHNKTIVAVKNGVKLE